MGANFIWCERNKGIPGVETQNVSNVNWKAVDDANEVAYPYKSYPIIAGTNSYQKWQYGLFSGIYTAIANVKLIHYSGNFGPGVSLVCQASMNDDADRIPSYITPTRTAVNNTTPFNLSPVNAQVSLFIGPNVNYSSDDGAALSGKALMQLRPSNGYLFTNYVVTQLQTTTWAQAGDTAPITLRVQWDEC